jgi:mRNA-degrading endonuclease RelE of RelBE toxin-antitoxin system
MNFRIADTFTDSLAKLTGEEQKVVKTTAFDLQMNPANPGMSFHKIDKARDKKFWSVRVSSELRMIVHKTDDSLLLCYVGQHDAAYTWAGRRKLETHPSTGAAQLVEIRETVQEITIPKYVEALQPRLPLFAHISEAALLGYGVPVEWLADVRLANEDTLLALADHLPAEAAEALLNLATGVTPPLAPPLAAGVAPFDHPDAMRRFRVMNNVEELTRALEYPWEKWTVFLHPAQRKFAEREYNGPARVSGSAGTGKTIVALHRAVFLARANPDARVLLITFSDILAHALQTKLRRLISNEPRLGERLEVQSMKAIGERLYERHFGRPHIVTRDTIKQLLAEAASATRELKFSLNFLLAEWEEMVDGWQLESWEAYRDVKRLGRKRRLPEPQRVLLWSIFAAVRAQLQGLGQITYAGMFSRLADKLADCPHPPFEYVVVDEAQDISVQQLRFLAALGDGRANGLFFAGDLGQRIFQQPFSWKSLGVDIRGRSRTLHLNYRTSHQIRMQADQLLGPEVADVDGNAEDRRGTVSVFNGPPPTIQTFDSRQAEIDAVGAWLTARAKDGVMAHEIGIFVRSPTPK